MNTLISVCNAAIEILGSHTVPLSMEHVVESDGNQPIMRPARGGLARDLTSQPRSCSAFELVYNSYLYDPATFSTLHDLWSRRSSESSQRAELSSPQDR